MLRALTEWNQILGQNITWMACCCCCFNRILDILWKTMRQAFFSPHLSQCYYSPNSHKISPLALFTVFKEVQIQIVKTLVNSVLVFLRVVCGLRQGWGRGMNKDKEHTIRVSKGILSCHYPYIFTSQIADHLHLTHKTLNPVFNSLSITQSLIYFLIWSYLLSLQIFPIVFSLLSNTICQTCMTDIWQFFFFTKLDGRSS